MPIKKNRHIKNMAQIKIMTNNFLTRVTKKNLDAKMQGKIIDELFSKKAVLRGTVSQIIRKKNSVPSIKDYFEGYFSRANIPGLSVLEKTFKIVKINNNLYSNYAYVKFNIDKETKVTAVMSFLWEKDKKTNKWEILLLHSQPIHLNVPPELIEQGDVFTSWQLPNQYFDN